MKLNPAKLFKGFLGIKEENVGGFKIGKKYIIHD